MLVLSLCHPRGSSLCCSPNFARPPFLAELQCKKAVTVGRANRAGFADIGKAYVRMGKASAKMGDKEQAIAYLEDAQVICYLRVPAIHGSVLYVWCALKSPGASTGIAHPDFLLQVYIRS